MKTIRFSFKLLPLIFGFLLLGSCAKDSEFQKISQVKSEVVEEPIIQAKNKGTTTNDCTGSITILGTSPSGLMWDLDVTAAACNDFDNRLLQTNYNWTMTPFNFPQMLSLNHDMNYWLLASFPPNTPAGSTVNCSYTSPQGLMLNFSIEEGDNSATFKVTCPDVEWIYDCAINEG